MKPAAGMPCCFSVARPGLGRLRGSTVFFWVFQKATLATLLCQTHQLSREHALPFGILCLTRICPDSLLDGTDALHWGHRLSTARSCGRRMEECHRILSCAAGSNLMDHDDHDTSCRYLQCKSDQASPGPGVGRGRQPFDII